MRVGLGEALDLFAKWKSNRTLLRCDLEFAAFAACFRGRIDDVSGDRVRFASDDSKTELVLPLSTDLEFALVEPRDREPDEGELFVSGLVLLLPDGEDSISFLELIDSSLL